MIDHRVGDAEFDANLLSSLSGLNPFSQLCHLRLRPRLLHRLYANRPIEWAHHLVDPAAGDAKGGGDLLEGEGRAVKHSLPQALMKLNQRHNGAYTLKPGEKMCYSGSLCSGSRY